MGGDTPLVTWSWHADGVALVTLVSPPMNLVGRSMLAALSTCLTEIAAAPGLGVVVVTGTGDRAFSAGADIKEFPQFAIETAIGGVALPGQRAFDQLAELAVPTIAAIEGVAFGGGCELALACDLRVVSEGARLGLPETGLGLFPCYGGTQRLPRLIGPALAKELIYTGRIVLADEALRIGLVNRIVPAGQALAAALELAESIAGRAGRAVQAAKQVINAGLDLSLVDGQALEAELADAIFATDDAREGVTAFVEKRPPQFRGR